MNKKFILVILIAAFSFIKTAQAQGDNTGVTIPFKCTINGAHIIVGSTKCPENFTLVNSSSQDKEIYVLASSNNDKTCSYRNMKTNALVSCK